MIKESEYKNAIESGKILSELLCKLDKKIKINVSGKELDDFAYSFITKKNAIPSFLHYHGFPKSICLSFNEEVVHGIPGDRRIQEGDLVSVDAGVLFKGIHTDAAFTKIVGNFEKEQDQKIVLICKKALKVASKNIFDNQKIVNMSSQIQKTVESAGFGVVRDYCGHGIGKNLHEPPSLPNFEQYGMRASFKIGQMYAVEPMVTIGSPKVKVGKNNWSVITLDMSKSAHFETTFLLTKKGVIDLVPWVLKK